MKRITFNLPNWFEVLENVSQVLWYSPFSMIARLVGPFTATLRVHPYTVETLVIRITVRPTRPPAGWEKACQQSWSVQTICKVVFIKLYNNSITVDPSLYTQARVSITRALLIPSLTSGSRGGSRLTTWTPLYWRHLWARSRDIQPSQSNLRSEQKKSVKWLFVTPS